MPGGLERLEHRNERLGITLRFTYAFHAREVRFERSRADGWESVFPETFSFQPRRHDPAELYLQLEDIWTNPARLAPAANRRDSQRAVRQLALALPGYLERMLDRLEAEGRLADDALARVHGDVAVLVGVMLRFLGDKELDSEADLRAPGFHLRKLAARTLRALVESRVSDAYLDRYVREGAEPFGPGEEISETGLFYALAEDDSASQARWIVALAERAFHVWLEDVCLDESNQAFEREGSPFSDREREVLEAVTASGSADLARGRDLVPFLRRRKNRDCMRVLQKLEAWFLRQYDVHHAAAAIQHHAHMERGTDDEDRTLSRHSARNYALGLVALVAPFVGALFLYDRAPRFFDAFCSFEVAAIMAGVFWFLAYRFCWRKDLSFFHASVPRIGAGIIVGYMPVFLIDEVWDLASESWESLLIVTSLLGFATLLYLFVEVQRRLGDSRVAFARARSIFLLGVLEALALGLLLTSLFGRFMAERNWGAGLGAETRAATFEALRETLPRVAGELPSIVGFEPFLAFPSAVLLMTFLSFFIGTFLQLMWEDFPLTEPL